MSPSISAFYKLVPGTDVVRFNESSILLCSDAVEVRLEGASALFFAETILPLVRDWVPLDRLIKAADGFDGESVRRQLQALCTAGVLLTSAAPPADLPAEAGPVVALLETLGLSADAAFSRLRQLKVAVVGLEAIGAHAAFGLCRSGVGRVCLVDPYASHPADLALMPAAPEQRAGELRQSLLARTLRGMSAATFVDTFTGESLDLDAIEGLVARHDLVIGSYDRGFTTVHHWINRAAIATGTPALFADLRATAAVLGPLVLPGESACYMCWRMRHLATRERFEDAMGYEEFNDNRREPLQHRRPALPALAQAAGGVLALEALKTLLGIGIPRLGGAVLVLDGLSLTLEHHRFLHRPDCPVCAGATTAVRKSRGDATA